MNDKLLDGQSFNQKYEGQTFIKLTNELENHNGYQFRTGLNIDTLPFNPKGECQAGGIYFCLIEHVNLWLNYSNKPMIYVRLVTIPNDAQVWIETNQFKTDRVILGDRQIISDLDVWNDNLYCLAAVQQCSWALKYVKEQTPEICSAAVKNNGWAIHYVRRVT